jgi:hypothetical protein
MSMNEAIELPYLPPAKGIDIQYRLMLCELADRATKQLQNLHFWQFKKRRLLEQVLFNIYKAQSHE